MKNLQLQKFFAYLTMIVGLAMVVGGNVWAANDKPRQAVPIVRDISADVRAMDVKIDSLAMAMRVDPSPARQVELDNAVTTCEGLRALIPNTTITRYTDCKESLK